MNIKIVAVGKLKENYLKDACKEYIKRLSRFAKVNIIEIPEEKLSEKSSQKEEIIAKNIEGDRMVEKIKDNEFVVMLSPVGKIISSTDFAEIIEQKAVSGVSNITFLIGGSNGVGESAQKRADYSLSFGKMTFPHQLFRVMLLEQIYRTFKINANEVYHK